MRRIANRQLRYFTDYEDQTPDLIIPEDLTALSPEELSELHTRAVEAFNALYGDGTGLSDADMETLETLTEGIEAMRADTERRETEAAERSAQAAGFAERVQPAAVEGTPEEGDGDDAGADGDGDGEGAEEAPAEEEPPAEDTPADGDEGDGDEEGAQEQEAVAASARPRRSGPRRVDLSGIRSRQGGRSSAPAEPASGEQRTMQDIVRAAPDVPGFSNGQGLDWTGVGRAVDARLRTFNEQTYARAAAAGRHMRQQFGVAVIEKPYADGLRVTSDDPNHIEQVMAHAADESRLPGGSLVASGGWCAPPTTIYDICEMESRDGLFDLPEISDGGRGSINHTLGPDFATIFADTGFEYTAEEDEAGDYDGEGGGSKPCYKVPCPPFAVTELDIAGICITAGLLQSRGYPEVIARTVRGALVAHDHKMSARRLNAIAAASTAVTMPASQVGATAPLLTAVELQVEHYREVRRLSRNQSVEIVLPFWVRGALRADLARRLGIDLLDVTDQRIDALIRSRGAAPQFVYNWQGIGSTAASGFTSYPTEVDFLLYAAGTWVGLGGDIITIDTLYDSVLLGTNDYTALFTEEGWAVAQRCHDSRVVTVPICPDGATHGGVEIDCDGSEGA